MTDMSARQSGPAPSESGGFKVTPKMIVGGVIAVLALWFILANRDSARVHMFVTSIGAPLWLVLLLTFLAGWLTGWLLRRRN